jgi:predicted ATPase
VDNQFIQKISIDWAKISTNSYLRKIDAIKNMDILAFNNPITFFVGENGSGKSTLLEAIAVAYGFNPEGGTKNYHFSTYDSHSELCNAIRITKGVRRPKCGYFLRAESFYNVATKEEEYADIVHPSEKYHERSHGEGFLTIVQNYMRADGVYIFDEPEAALSPQRQLTLLIDMYKCSKEGAQFIIATHSPILLGIPNADIYSFNNGKIYLCEYEETDSYAITKMFINNRNNLLHKLLD